MLLMLLPASPSGAQAPSVERQIYANMGNINTSGLPQIRIPLGNAGMLSRMGFAFAMTHHVVSGYGRSVRAEWKISGLRTCVYLDGKGDLVWVRPNMQQLVFKKEHSYQQERLGWSVHVQNDTREIEFTHPNGQRWTYVAGYLSEISDRLGTVDFVTDHETILLATRRGRAAALVLMRAEYSSGGLLERLELWQSRPLIFHWSGEPALLAIDGLGAGRMTFDYKNRLLREWNDDNGRRKTYTWVARDEQAKSISFGGALVRLQSDSEFRYEYEKADGANIIRVFRNDGSFVSETHFGDRGIVQKAGDRTTKAIYRNDGTGRRLVIEP